MLSLCTYFDINLGFDSLTEFDFSIKLSKKMVEYNIPASYKGYAVINKIENESENIYHKVPQILKYCYHEKHFRTSMLPDGAFLNFKHCLGNAIIKNTLTENNKFIDDFTFKINEAEFLFSSFEDDEKKYILFAFLPINEAANYLYDSYDKSSIIDFVSHVKCDTFAKFIKNNCDIDELKKLYSVREHKQIAKNVIEVFSKNDDYSRIDFVKYDGIRLEPNFIKAVVKIAEYLGHGSYLGDMKQSTKNSISDFIFNQYENSDYAISKGLLLEKSCVFYTGKGPQNEKLIVIS